MLKFIDDELQCIIVVVDISPVVMPVVETVLAEMHVCVINVAVSRFARIYSVSSGEIGDTGKASLHSSVEVMLCLYGSRVQEARSFHIVIGPQSLLETERRRPSKVAPR